MGKTAAALRLLAALLLVERDWDRLGSRPSLSLSLRMLYHLPFSFTSLSHLETYLQS